MAKSLWGFYDGEPFMENPQLGLLGVTNPRKGKKMAAKRRRKSNAKRRTYRHRTHHRKNAPARRRRNRSRARRNWIGSGMIVPPNPHRRHHRRRARRSNPKRRHHRRHNPAFMGLAIPPIKTVLFAGVGFVGPSMVSGILTTTFPTVMQTVTNLGIAGKYIMKIGTVALLAWATKKFVGAGEAMSVAIGGGVNIAVSLANDFVPGILPANPLSMYMPTRPGMRAYVPVRGGLRGPYQLQAGPTDYPQAAAVRSIPTAAVYPSSLTDSRQYGMFGGTANRLLRY